MRLPHTVRLAAIIAVALTLSACAGKPYHPVSDVPVRIGKPYQVRGVTYAPAADPGYDKLGLASWYGPESGSRTANGEHFRPDGISAAHTTLPLPSYVEVTALATGRRIIVRVNDRGPFVRGGRIIDLSRGAATLLGIKAQGPAPVRVRAIDPSDRDRERLRDGKPARDLPAVGEGELRALRAQFAGGRGAVPPQM